MRRRPRKAGYSVTVLRLFTSRAACWSTAFRIPPSGDIVAGEGCASWLEIRTNMVVGKAVSVDELFQGYEAVFWARGRPAQLHGHRGRVAKRRIFRQRVPDAHKPHEGLSARGRHADYEPARSPLWEAAARRHGRGALCQAHGRAGSPSYTAGRERAARSRRSAPRQGGERIFRLLTNRAHTGRPKGWVRGRRA